MNDKPRFWKPNRTLARWLMSVFVVQAVANAGCIFLREADRWERVNRVLRNTDFGDAAFNRQFTDAMKMPNSGWITIAGYAGTAALVLLIIWSWRAANNALALGRTGARQSPGWVIAGWLVPFLNLVLPYQTMSDLWRSSAPDADHGDGWRAQHPSGRIATWWVAYLLGLGIIPLATVWMIVADWPADDAQLWFSVGRGIAAVAALLGAWVVWDITERQTRQHDVDPAPTLQQAQAHAGAYGYGTPVATPIVRGPDGMPVPGWYADPSGAFDFRYWDGVAWTEHVSRGGVAAVAPVAAPAPTEIAAPTAAAIAPDWFPDPSGRHQWRFWGGDGWTPHVSDDDVHSDDPLDAPAPPPVPDAAQ